MRSIIWTIILFLSVVTLTSFVAVADDPKSTTLDVESANNLSYKKVIKFVDGDVTCYMPSNRSGISCIKN